MKKHLALLALLLPGLFALAADLKISQLPLGSGSTTGVNDSLPYVDSAHATTKQLKLSDITSIPTVASLFALKAPLASPVFTGTVNFSGLTANTVPYLDNASNLQSSAVTPTQLGYLDATSSIQTQLNGKQASLGFTPVPNTRQVNGHALSSDVTVSASDVGLGNVTNTAQVASDGTVGLTADWNAGAHTITATTFSGALSGNATTATTATTAGNVSGTVAIANGGTGQITANAALSALLPSQATAAGEYLGSNGTDSSWNALALSSSLSDVLLASPTVNQLLAFNGSQWVNTTPSFSNAGSGVEFFLDDAATVDGYGGLLSAPNTVTGTHTDSISLTANTVFGQGYLFNHQIGGTQLDPGEWEFDIYADVNSTAAGSVSTVGVDVFDVQLGAGTVTVTGSGTSRTATVTGGTPFISGDANANQRLAGYLQTPGGTFQVTAFTSSSVVTITTPGGYVNESAVTYSKHLFLFGVNTPALTTTVQQLYSVVVVQPAFVLAASTDQLSIRTYGTSTNTRTVNYYHNGTTAYSHLHSPLISRHNTLAGLQGGDGTNYYHLGATEYTGTGTGVFARQASPTFTGTVSATTFSGALSGNATTATTATSFSGSLSGDVTGTQGSTAISATTVTGKAITGFISGAGAVSATDTILSAIDKFDGNIATKLAKDGSVGLTGDWNAGAHTITATTFSGALSGNATTATSATSATTATTATNFSGSLSGDVTGTQGSTAISASTVTGKAITGFVSGSGTVAATDTILQAVNKLDGNTALKSPIASPTFTGVVTTPTVKLTTSPTVGYVWTASNVDGSGGWSPPAAVSSRTSTTKTTTYTILSTDDIIRGDATSGAFTITLPAVASSTGKVFTIKKVDTTVNAVTVQGNASELIDFANTFLLSNAGDTITVFCNGTNWDII